MKKNLSELVAIAASRSTRRGADAGDNGVGSAERASMEASNGKGVTPMTSRRTVG
jgi:hypothetical protein